MFHKDDRKVKKRNGGTWLKVFSLVVVVMMVGLIRTPIVNADSGWQMLKKNYKPPRGFNLVGQGIDTGFKVNVGVGEVVIVSWDNDPKWKENCVLERGHVFTINGSLDEVPWIRTSCPLDPPSGEWRWRRFFFEGGTISFSNGDDSGYGYVYFKPASPTPVPIVLTVTPGCNRNVLTWTDTVGDLYDIERCVGVGCSPTTRLVSDLAAFTYTNTGLTNGTTYVYRVVEANSDVTSNNASGVPVCLTNTPTPGCNISIPATVSMNTNSTNPLDVTVTSQTGGTVDRLTFSSSVPTRVSVTTPDTTPPSFSSTMTSNTSTGTAVVTTRGYMNGNTTTIRCSDTSTVTVNSLVCQRPSPANPSGVDCATSGITWEWPAVAGATEYNVDVFNSADPPPGPPYYIDNAWQGAGNFGCGAGGTCWYTTSGLPDGGYQVGVGARGIVCLPSVVGYTGVVTVGCQTTWFGAGGGDVVAAGGDLRTILPPVPVPPKFISDLAGSNLSGMAMGTRVTGNLTSANVSSEGWLVNNLGQAWSSIVGRAENSYLVMSERLLAQANQPVAITESSLSQNQLNAKVNAALAAAGSRITTPVGNVGLLRKQNSGNLTLSSINLGTRRAIILVEPGAGDVTFSGTADQKVIGFDSGGFLAVISANNLLVDPGVGVADGDGDSDDDDDDNDGGAGADIGSLGYTPHLEGIFFAGGWFRTGASAQQLRVDGTVIGMQGVALERTFRGVYPAEFFQFRPDLTYVLSETGLRRKIFQELGVP